MRQIVSTSSMARGEERYSPDPMQNLSGKCAVEGMNSSVCINEMNELENLQNYKILLADQQETCRSYS